MPTARVVLYLALIIVNVAAIATWIWYAKRRHLRDRPSLADMVIGFVANFLDTLGIGSYAQITALFKMQGRPKDELIPGTLNVGGIVPSFVGCWLFVIAITVEPILLTCMVVSSAVGAWIGADIVSRLPRRAIQIFMGVALLIAAIFFLLTNLGVSVSAGAAMGLTGWRFCIAIAANFVLGALMCIGIGNYAPTMAILGLLGMNPIAAYPIMMGSDGLLIPVAAMGFLRSQRFSHVAALGLTLGGVVGTLCAFPLVNAIGSHLSLMRWLVIFVVIYAAVSMLLSARNKPLPREPILTS
jgi:uncharacterized membrane protein YfcA